MQVCTSPRQIDLTMPAPCDRIIITPFSVVSDLTAKFQVVPFRARFYVPFRHTATRPTEGFVVVDRDGHRPSGAGPGRAVAAPATRESAAAVTVGATAAYFSITASLVRVIKIRPSAHTHSGVSRGPPNP